MSLIRRSARAFLILAWMAAPDVAHAQEATETRTDAIRSRSVALDYSYVSFTDKTAPWQLSSLSLGRRSTHGSVIGRLNVANRFNTRGSQLEVDGYPRLGGGRYAYLNAGYSGASIFPQWRFGGELFTSLPRSMEASLGFRQLRFGGPPVTLLTGAVGLYRGNYWYSLRPYLRSKPTGTSASLGLTTRRYYADGDHYVGLRASYGSSPSDAAAGDSLSLSAARTNSFSAAVQGSGGWWKDLLGTWSLGYDREGLAPGRLRRSVTASAGLRYLF